MVGEWVAAKRDVDGGSSEAGLKERRVARHIDDISICRRYIDENMVRTSIIIVAMLASALPTL